MARFLTTHQIAKMLGVSERTVANWIDRSHLDAFRTPGGHRRVSPASLKEFLRKRKMPIPDELAEDVRILIVEDDPLVAQTLHGYLESDNPKYDVAAINDGVSALIDIGNRKPHVVLLDILMPGMDGLEVCRKIRDNPSLADVKVIFVTGYAEVDPETIVRDTGASDVLRKPVRGPALREAVERALAESTGVRR